jgi:hypothetical protein
MSHKEDAQTNITVGNITNATGVAIGPGASASVDRPSQSVQHQAVAELDKFIRSLPSFAESLPDADATRNAAVAARTKAAHRSPRWDEVRRLLGQIAVSVAGISALTEAIINIQAIVAHLGG